MIFYENSVKIKCIRRGDRVVDGTCLENKRGATHREFESRPLRQMCYNFVVAAA